MDEARKTLESLCIRYSAKAGEAGVTASVAGVEELIQDFALSLSDKIGVGGEATQAAAFILVSSVILETFQQVLSIGGGVKNLDLSCLTLHQIKKGLQRVERKVDKLLISPLKSAMDHFTTAVNLMVSHDFDLANKTLEKVIDKATDGLNNMEDKYVNLETFKECGTAVKLIVFSKILVFSYDSKMKLFLPYLLLSADRRELIAKELRTQVDRCIALRANVKLGGLFTDKQERKEVQEIVETILQRTYPYMCSHDGMDQVIPASKVTKDIIVKPEYLPASVENKANVNIGVINESLMSINIWRSKKSIFTQIRNHKVHEHETKVDLDSTSEDVKVFIQLPIIIRRSRGTTCTYWLQNRCTRTYCEFRHELLHDLPTGEGKGKAAQKQGSCFGQYEYCGQLNGSPYYIQLHNVSGEAYYLFKSKTERWYVSKKLGDVENWNLLNSAQCENVPESGWMFKDVSWTFRSDPNKPRDSVQGDSLQSFTDNRKHYKTQIATQTCDYDETIVVSPGVLTHCGPILVRLRGAVADKYPNHGGEFTVDPDMWRKGRPIYRKSSFCHSFP